MAAAAFLDTLIQARDFLENDFVEQPPSPPQTREVDQDRILNLNKLVQQAYVHSEGNTASGKWTAIPRLLRLGVTSGRAGRWIGARPDRPPQVALDEEATEDRPEHPVQRWEPRTEVTERIQDWQKGILPLSVDRPPEPSFDLSYMDPVAHSGVPASTPSSADHVSSKANDPLKSSHPLGFNVAKPTRQSMKKDAASRKEDNGLEAGEESQRVPLSSRGAIASIADLPDIDGSVMPPPSFPSSQLVTSTPFALRRPLSSLEGSPSAKPLPMHRPTTPPLPRTNDDHRDDFPSSPVLPPLLPSCNVANGQKEAQLVGESQDATSNHKALPTRVAPLRSVQLSPKIASVAERAFPPTHSPKGTSTLLNANGKRDRQGTALNLSSPPDAHRLGQGVTDVPASKRPRGEAPKPALPSPSKADHDPVRDTQAPESPMASSSRDAIDTSSLPTLTELLASAKRTKGGHSSAKRLGDTSPSKGSRGKKLTGLRPITSIFPKLAKENVHSSMQRADSIEDKTNPVAPSVAVPTFPRLSLPPAVEASEELDPFLEASALAIDLVDLPVDLTSPTKSLSSIADSDSDLGSDFGYDDKEAFGDEDGDDLDDPEEHDEGMPRKLGRPQLPKSNNQSLITSAFKFRPFATSTQKEAAHHVSSSSPFRHLTASAPGSDAAGDVAETNGRDSMSQKGPPSSSIGVPAYTSQSGYNRQIAKKIMDVNRVLDEDLDFGLKAEPLKNATRRSGSDSDSGEDEVKFEKEMSGWVRGASLDDELASP